MDELDSILLEAWNRIGEGCRRDRVQALKRSRRRFKTILTQPVRELCLVIRASDARINSNSAIIEPDWGRALPMEAMDDPIGWSLAHGLPHTVTLDGKLIRKLTTPVEIPWPGVTIHEAAKLCGRDYITMKQWVKKGAFQIDHYHEFKFPRTNRHGEDMPGRPRVWTPSPIDPNNFTGRTPHAMWGSLWQSQWKKLPEDYMFTVRRVPRIRPGVHGKTKGKKIYRGWEFVCPGRLDGNNEYKGCGRHCTYLYAPQSMWTISKALFTETEGGEGFDMPEDSGLTGQWFPGLSDPVKDAAEAEGGGTGAGGGRSFACHKCWGMHRITMSDHRGWNDFVTQISGGLLYGSDVPRPLHICPIERKHKEYKWRPAEERAAAKKLKTATNEEDGGGERQRLA